MSAPALAFSRVLRAPVPHAFAAVTEARHLERWFCDAAESDAREGGVLVLRWMRSGSPGLPFEARWLEVAPPIRARFRGGHAGYPAGDAGEVTLSVVDLGAGCRVDIRHTVPDGDAFAPHLVEWRAAWPRALDRLERYLTPAASDEGVPA
jgi:uncharacterized protein YndB with AHSA1/START domain